MSRISPLVRCAALSLALVAAPVLADRILDPGNPPPLEVVSLDDNNFSADQVRGAIIAGAAVDGWVLKSEAAGSLVLKLDKGQYSAEVRLRYSADGFSIEYVASSNLEYRRAADPGSQSGSMPCYTDLVGGLIRAVIARVSAIPAAR